jgi:hypothetical protein
MNRFLYAWLLTCAVIITIGGSFLFYLSQLDGAFTSPFTFAYTETPILTPVVHPSENIRWKVDVQHNTTGLEVRTSRQIRCTNPINQVISIYSPVPPETSYITSGKHEIFEGQAQLPSEVKPGRCILVIYNYVRINSIRVITIIRESEPFTVI